MLTTFSTSITSAVESINTGAELRAEADRNSFSAAITALAASNARRGGTRDHSSSRSDRHEKVEDLAASIIKSQKTAVDWVNEPENILDPDVIKVDVWKHELNQQFSSSFCVDVGKFAGYECYKRQSNDLHDFISLHENAYHDRHASSMAEMGGTAEEKRMYAQDAITCFMNGETVRIGRHAQRFRKLLHRQAMGFEHTVVIIDYDIATLDQAFTTVGASIMWNEGSSWYPVLSAMISAGAEIIEPGRRDDAARRRTRESQGRFLVKHQDEEIRDASADGREPRPALARVQSEGLSIYAKMPDTQKRALWDFFHNLHPNTALPVKLDPQLYMRRVFSADEMLDEPLQIPIIPNPNESTITFRHKGKLHIGNTFTLRRVTNDTSMDRIYPVVDNGGHVYVDASSRDRYVDPFPTIAAYDELDQTGQFRPQRSMTKAMWDATDNMNTSLRTRAAPRSQKATTATTRSSQTTKPSTLWPTSFPAPSMMTPNPG